MLVIGAALLIALAAGPAAAQATFTGFGGETLTAPPAPVAPAPEPREADAGRDATAEYLQAAAAGPDRSLELRRYKVLLVPGLFSNVDKSKLPVAGIFFSSATKPRYEEHMAVLRDLGVEYERLALQTESSVKTNGAEIAAAVRASAKPVIILASSKAGLDVLDGLISDSGLAGKVRGVVMLQAPFRGTPVADRLIDDADESSFLGRILESLGGSIDCMADLTTERTSAYLRRNAAAIARLTSDVPVISVATWVDKKPRGVQDTGLKPLRNYLLKKGYRNDGLVPYESAILPGSDYVLLPDADHGATAQPTRLDFDRKAMTRAVISMVMKRRHNIEEALP
jgi:hypothetical protein